MNVEYGDVPLACDTRPRLTTRDNLYTAMARLRTFRDTHNWQQYHTPEALARAVAVEVGELNELFLWGCNPEPMDVAPEIADVMIYCLNLCMALDIDPIDAIHQKISFNETRAYNTSGKLQSPHEMQHGSDDGYGPAKVPGGAD